MKKHWFGVTAVVTLLVLPFLTKTGQEGAPVEFEVAATHPVRASILASGSLEFRDQSKLSPEILGEVRSVLVKEGDVVAQGQLVLELDAQVYRAAVAQQEATVRLARLNIERQELSLANQRSQYERSEKMHAQQLLDENSFDAARHAFDLAELEVRGSRDSAQQAEAALNQAQEQLAKTEIRSPIGGTVVAIEIKVGETAVPSSVGIAGSTLMTIAKTSSLMAELNVDEADIARIRVGQDVAIFAAAYPDTMLSGQVESIPMSPRSVGGPGQGSASLSRDYSVKVKLRDLKGLTLRPGMTCRAEVFTTTADEIQTLAVPVQAVFSNNSNATESFPGKAPPQEEFFVFVDHNGKAERRIVQIGLSDDSYEQIRSGLKVGERVLIGPYKVLRYFTGGESIKASVEKVESKSL